MTESQLRDIEEGTKRWHSVSSETVKKLVARIRELELENNQLREFLTPKKAEA